MKQRNRLNPRKIASNKELAKYFGVHYNTIARRLKKIKKHPEWRYSTLDFLYVYDKLCEVKISGQKLAEGT